MGCALWWCTGDGRWPRHCISLQYPSDASHFHLHQLNALDFINLLRLSVLNANKRERERNEGNVDGEESDKEIETSSIQKWRKWGWSCRGDYDGGDGGDTKDIEWAITMRFGNVHSMWLIWAALMQMIVNWRQQMHTVQPAAIDRWCHCRPLNGAIVIAILFSKCRWGTDIEHRQAINIVCSKLCLRIRKVYSIVLLTSFSIAHLRFHK